jgi:chitodextrinase
MDTFTLTINIDQLIGVDSTRVNTVKIKTSHPIHNPDTGAVFEPETIVALTNGSGTVELPRDGEPLGYGYIISAPQLAAVWYLDVPATGDASLSDAIMDPLPWNTRPGYAHGDVSGAVDLPLAYGVQQMTLVGNTSLTVSGRGEDTLLQVTQGNPGSWSLTIDGTTIPLDAEAGSIHHMLVVQMPDQSVEIFMVDGPGTTPTLPVDTTPPSAPVVSLGSKTATRVTITWTASTDNIAVDRYQASHDNGATTHEVLNAGTTWPRTWTFYGLTPNTAYTMRVRAIDAYGNAGAWGTLAVTTDAGTPDAAPTAPTGLVATPSLHSIALSWSAGTDDNAVVAYRVSKDGGATWEADWITDLDYTVTGLTEDTTYAIRVQAGDAAGQWSPSLSASVETLAPITENSFVRANFNEGSGTDLLNLAGAPNGEVQAATFSVGREGAGDYGLRQFGASSWGAAHFDFDPGTGGAAPKATAGWTGMTIMLWVSYDAFGVGEIAGMYAWGADPTKRVLLNMVTSASGSTLVGLTSTIGLVAGNASVRASPALSIARGTVIPSVWHHYCVTWNKSDGAHKLYLDAVQVGSATNGAGGAIHPEMRAVIAGARNPGNDPHGGTHDDLRVFDRAVSAADIAVYMQQPVIV